jgi:hypothetical protein
MADFLLSPPFALAIAEERFKEFLTQNGYPPDGGWILTKSILIDKSVRYFVRHAGRPVRISVGIQETIR